MRTVAALALVALAVSGCSSVTSGQGTGRSHVSPGASSPAGSHPVGSSAPAPATGSSASSGSSTTAASTGSTHATPPAAQSPLRTMSVSALDGSATYRVSVWAEDRITDCAAHSYGQVVQYFRQHPCQSASRRLITLPVGGRTVAMSVIAVGCAAAPQPNVYLYAGQFASLERADGTGSINDLLREGHRMPGATAIPSSEAFTVLGQDLGVFVMDAWYADGNTASQDPDLLALEQNLILTAVTA